MDAPDAAIMVHAVTNDLVVLTQDLDFGAILAASGESYPSVPLRSS
jgi:predicted nuclease of predicted toxin-antitoxin system